MVAEFFYKILAIITGTSGYLSAKKPSGSKNSQNSSGSSYALDTPPGMDTQDPYADADAGYAIDTPAGMDTQDPLAD